MHGLRNNLTVKKAAQVEYLSLKCSRNVYYQLKAYQKCKLTLPNLMHRSFITYISHIKLLAQQNNL